jgi:hypothetical protein
MKPSAPLYNVLVMFVLTTVGAVLQDGLPPLAWGALKPPFLLAVATYYALLRPLPYAVPAVLWCGLLQDGLGSLPDGTSLAGMVALLAFCVLWGRSQLPESRLMCVLVGAGSAVILSLIEYVSLRMSGLLPSLPWSFVFPRAALCGAFAIPVCAVTAAVAGLLDQLALNTRTENDADGFDWSGGRV